MKRKFFAVSSAAILVFTIGALFVWTNGSEAIASETETETETEISVDLEAGQTLYLENCASCHGVDLEGQENWRSAGDDGVLPAPPHDKTGHTWHHPDSLLFNYTKLGGKELLASQGIEFNSGMPAFGDVLSDPEILNVIAYIKSTWPERQREIQASRTQADIKSKGASK